MTRRLARIVMPVAALGIASLAWPGGAEATKQRTGGVRACSLGRVVAERTLVSPRARTFYSVDALNPDVVRWRGRYLMYFSGNDQHTAGGRWRTGLAVSDSPAGPFAVRPGLSMPYLNGGTAVWRNRLWQAAERSDRPPVSELRTSRDGTHWQKVADIPMATGDYRLTADPSLQVVGGRLRLWLIGRTDPMALRSDVAYLDFRRGRWSRPRTVLRTGGSAWSAVDLGEPYALRLGGRDLLLYVGTAAAPFERSVGLAQRAGTSRWRPCPNPLIPAGAAPWGRAISIDPSVVARGRRIYVYYGGGSNTSIASDTAGAIGVRVYRATDTR